jgi:hypothetical protein
MLSMLLVWTLSIHLTYPCISMLFPWISMDIHGHFKAVHGQSVAGFSVLLSVLLS